LPSAPHVGVVTSCCSFGIPSILAIIFGHVAMGDTGPGQKNGRGMAVAGLVTGYVGVAPAVILSVWMIFGAGVSAVGVS
jgi:hypothetical protein